MSSDAQAEHFRTIAAMGDAPAPDSTLARALVAAQAMMPAVPKDSDNPHFRSKFTSLDSLIAATRPILNQFGLALTQFPAMDGEGRPVLRTTLTHGPSGEERTAETPLYLASPTMQNLGSAVTYARRYAWASLLGIASEEDNDGGAPPPSADKAKTAYTPEAPKMTSPAQKAKMAAQVRQLENDNAPLPVGAENWTEALRAHLGEEYGVSSRTELTSAQASAVIDWLEAQAIPF